MIYICSSVCAVVCYQSFFDCVCVVFYVFYSLVSSIVWLAMMMSTAVIALLSSVLLGHLLSFHIYLSKWQKLVEAYAVIGTLTALLFILL